MIFFFGTYDIWNMKAVQLTLNKAPTINNTHLFPFRSVSQYKHSATLRVEIGNFIQHYASQFTDICSCTHQYTQYSFTLENDDFIFLSTYFEYNPYRFTFSFVHLVSN